MMRHKGTIVRDLLLRRKRLWRHEEVRVWDERREHLLLEPIRWTRDREPGCSDRWWQGLTGNECTIRSNELEGQSCWRTGRYQWTGSWNRDAVSYIDTGTSRSKHRRRGHDWYVSYDRIGNMLHLRHGTGVRVRMRMRMRWCGRWEGIPFRWRGRRVKGEWTYGLLLLLLLVMMMMMWMMWMMRWLSNEWVIFYRWTRRKGRRSCGRSCRLWIVSQWDWVIEMIPVTQFWIILILMILIWLVLPDSCSDRRSGFNSMFIHIIRQLQKGNKMRIRLTKEWCNTVPADRDYDPSCREFAECVSSPNQ